MLNGKSVFITGCNRGIGKDILRKIAENNAELIFAHARKESEEYSKYIEELSKEYDTKIIPIYFDMTDVDDMKSSIREINKMKLPIDVLVNNAGVAHGGLFQMTPVSKIKEVFDINFFSHLELTQMVLKLMKKQGRGSIVNISSVSGLDLKSGNCAYGTSKAALIAFTKTLAQEVASIGVRVNAIAPGLTDTDMAKLMEHKAGDEMVRSSAMNRLGKTSEIADAVIYLASNKSSFITGQVLRVDGGM